MCSRAPLHWWPCSSKMTLLQQLTRLSRDSSESWSPLDLHPGEACSELCHRCPSKVHTHTHTHTYMHIYLPVLQGLYHMEMTKIGHDMIAFSGVRRPLQGCSCAAC